MDEAVTFAKTGAKISVSASIGAAALVEFLVGLDPSTLLSFKSLMSLTILLVAWPIAGLLYLFSFKAQISSWEEREVGGVLVSRIEDVSKEEVEAARDLERAGVWYERS